MIKSLVATFELSGRHSRDLNFYLLARWERTLELPDDFKRLCAMLKHRSTSTFSCLEGMR